MGSKSSSSTSQQTSAVDRRQALDGSLGISGDFSTIDLSNRSVTNTTSNVDLSNRSTNNTTTNISYTDQGAIQGAVSVLNNSIAANKDTFGKFADTMGASEKNALDFGVRVTDDAFAAVKQSGDSTAEIARIAMANTADAWNNAKTGAGLGDYKYVAYAALGVFALMAWKRR